MLRVLRVFSVNSVNSVYLFCCSRLLQRGQLLFRQCPPFIIRFVQFQEFFIVINRLIGLTNLGVNAGAWEVGIRIIWGQIDGLAQIIDGVTVAAERFKGQTAVVVRARIVVFQFNCLAEECDRPVNLVRICLLGIGAIINRLS